MTCGGGGEGGGGQMGVLNEPLWSLIEDGGAVVRPSVRLTQCGGQQPTTLTRLSSAWVPESEEFREAHNPSIRKRLKKKEWNSGCCGCRGWVVAPPWWCKYDHLLLQSTWNDLKPQSECVCVSVLFLFFFFTWGFLFFFSLRFFVCLFARDGVEEGTIVRKQIQTGKLPTPPTIVDCGTGPSHARCISSEWTETIRGDKLPNK